MATSPTLTNIRPPEPTSGEQVPELLTERKVKNAAERLREGSDKRPRITAESILKKWGERFQPSVEVPASQARREVCWKDTRGAIVSTRADVLIRGF